MVFYAVAKGREVGIFHSWAECELQVKGFKGAKFKKFKTKVDAQNYITNQAQESIQPAAPPRLAAVVQKGISTRLSSQHQLPGKQQIDSQVNEGFSAIMGMAERASLNSPLRVRIKKEPFECKDYIPLENPVENKPLAVKQEIKEEDLDNSLWFQDNEGDKELLLAMSTLENTPEYRNAKCNTKIRQKQNAQPSDAPFPSKTIKIRNYNFTVDKDGFVDVFLGGYGENIGQWNCMAGYGVYFGNKHPLNVAEPATGRMTVNVGAIEAAIHAIETAKQVGIEKLCLHTDSEFLLNTMTSWIYGWKRNGWRNKNGKVVQNRKEIQKLDSLIASDDITVKWHNVKGYRNAVKPMREAKKLAKCGTDEYLELHPSKDVDGEFGDLDGFDFCGGFPF